MATINETVIIDAQIELSNLAQSTRAAQKSTATMMKGFDKVTKSVSSLNNDIVQTTIEVNELSVVLKTLNKTDLKQVNKEVDNLKKDIKKTTLETKRFNRELKKVDDKKVKETTADFKKMDAQVREAIRSVKELNREIAKVQKLNISVQSKMTTTTRTTGGSRGSSSGVPTGASSAASMTALTAAIVKAIHMGFAGTAALMQTAIAGALSGGVAGAVISKSNGGTSKAQLQLPDFSNEKLLLPDFSDLKLELPDFSDTKLPDSHLPDFSALKIPRSHLPDFSAVDENKLFEIERAKIDAAANLQSNQQFDDNARNHGYPIVEAIDAEVVASVKQFSTTIEMAKMSTKDLKAAMEAIKNNVSKESAVAAYQEEVKVLASSTGGVVETVGVLDESLKDMITIIRHASENIQGMAKSGAYTPKKRTRDDWGGSHNKADITKLERQFKAELGVTGHNIQMHSQDYLDAVDEAFHLMMDDWVRTIGKAGHGLEDAFGEINNANRYLQEAIGAEVSDKGAGFGGQTHEPKKPFDPIADAPRKPADHLKNLEAAEAARKEALQTSKEQTAETKATADAAAEVTRQEAENAELRNFSLDSQEEVTAEIKEQTAEIKEQAAERKKEDAGKQAVDQHRAQLEEILKLNQQIIDFRKQATKENKISASALSKVVGGYEQIENKLIELRKETIKVANETGGIELNHELNDQIQLFRKSLKDVNKEIAKLNKAEAKETFWQENVKINKDYIDSIKDIEKAEEDAFQSSKVSATQYIKILKKLKKEKLDAKAVKLSAEGAVPPPPSGPIIKSFREINSFTLKAQKAVLLLGVTIKDVAGKIGTLFIGIAKFLGPIVSAIGLIISAVAKLVGVFATVFKKIASMAYAVGKQIVKAFSWAFGKVVDLAKWAGRKAVEFIKWGLAGVTALGVVAFRTAEKWQASNAKLKLVSSSFQEWQDLQKGIFQVAQDTRMEYVKTVNLFVDLSNAMAGMDITNKTLLQTVKVINQAIAFVGDSALSTDAALVQFGQAFAADFKSAGQEMNSVREQAKGLFNTILEGLEKNDKKFSRNQFKKMLEDGEISAQLIKEALVSMADEVDAKFATIPLAFSHALNSIQNQWGQMVAKLNQTIGLTSLISQSLKDLGDWAFSDDMFEAVLKGLKHTIAGFLYLKANWPLLVIELERTFVILQLVFKQIKPYIIHLYDVFKEFMTKIFILMLNLDKMMAIASNAMEIVFKESLNSMYISFIEFMNAVMTFVATGGFSKVVELMTGESVVFDFVTPEALFTDKDMAKIKANTSTIVSSLGTIDDAKKESLAALEKSFTDLTTADMVDTAEIRKLKDELLTLDSRENEFNLFDPNAKKDMADFLDDVDEMMEKYKEKQASDEAAFKKRQDMVNLTDKEIAAIKAEFGIVKTISRIKAEAEAATLTMLQAKEAALSKGALTQQQQNKFAKEAARIQMASAIDTHTLNRANVALAEARVQKEREASAIRRTKEGLPSIKFEDQHVSPEALNALDTMNAALGVTKKKVLETRIAFLEAGRAGEKAGKKTADAAKKAAEAYRKLGKFVKAEIVVIKAYIKAQGKSFGTDMKAKLTYEKERLKIAIARAKKEWDIAKAKLAQGTGSQEDVVKAEKTYWVEVKVDTDKMKEDQDKVIDAWNSVVDDISSSFASVFESWMDGDLQGAFASLFGDLTKEVIKFAITAGAQMGIFGAEVATVAIANQALGEPYTAWVRMAAMAATMAALGLAVAVGGGGGGGPTEAEMAEAKGNQFSENESVNESLEILAANQEIGLVHSASMMNSLDALVAAAGAAAISVGDRLSGTDYVSKDGSGIWGGQQRELIATGVKIDSASIKELTDGTLKGYEYMTEKVTKESWFGLKKRESLSERKTGDIDTSFADAYTEALLHGFEAVNEAAITLGMTTQEIDQFTKDYETTVKNLNFEGMDAEERQELIISALGEDMDAYAASFVPLLGYVDQFALAGEEVSTTIIRLANDYEVASLMFDKLGLEMASIADGGLAVTEALVQAAGGAEAFSQTWNQYFEDFYTEAEQTAAKSRALNASFAAIGMTIPTTVEGYRALVDAQIAELTAISATIDAEILAVDSAWEYAQSLYAVGDAQYEAAKTAYDEGQVRIDALKDERDELAASTQTIIENSGAWKELNETMANSYENMKQFWDIFGTKEEQMAFAADHLEMVFAAVGMSVPVSKEAFKALYLETVAKVEKLKMDIKIRKAENKLYKDELFAARARIEAHYKLTEAELLLVGGIIAGAKTMVEALAAIDAAIEGIDLNLDGMIADLGELEGQLGMMDENMSLIGNFYGSVAEVSSSFEDAANSSEDAAKAMEQMMLSVSQLKADWMDSLAGAEMMLAMQTKATGMAGLTYDNFLSSLQAYTDSIGGSENMTQEDLADWQAMSGALQTLETATIENTRVNEGGQYVAEMREAWAKNDVHLQETQAVVNTLAKETGIVGLTTANFLDEFNKAVEKGLTTEEYQDWETMSAAIESLTVAEEELADAIFELSRLGQTGVYVAEMRQAWEVDGQEQVIVDAYARETGLFGLTPENFLAEFNKAVSKGLTIEEFQDWQTMSSAMLALKDAIEEQTAIMVGGVQVVKMRQTWGDATQQDLVDATAKETELYGLTPDNFIAEFNKAVSEGMTIAEFEDWSSMSAALQPLLNEQKAALNAEKKFYEDVLKAIEDAYLGSLSYLNSIEKAQYAAQLAQDDLDEGDTEGYFKALSKQLENEKKMSVTREDYARKFDDYIEELQNAKYVDDPAERSADSLENIEKQIADLQDQIEKSSYQP